MKITLITLVALIATGALARQVPNINGTFAQGTGVVTCGEFAQAYRRNPTQIEAVFYSWAQGFMTGLNLGGPSSTAADVTRISVPEQQRRIREFCDMHPLRMYVEAVIDVYNALPQVAVPPSDLR